jgi:TatD DNase family protein
MGSLCRSSAVAATAVRAPVIDSHCHLADETFSTDLEGVIGRAREAGLERALVILEAGNEQEATQARRVHELWPDVRTAVGIHPHAAHEYGTNTERVVSTVRDQIARTPQARAVGEIGLDYHYDYSPRDVQRAVFRAQVRLARELRLPVVIHTREADEDTMSVLRDEGQGELNGVLHCFSGTADLARAGLDLGFYVSFAGMVTFNNAGTLRETARLIPIDRLMTETDSPFLAPVPHRGKRNEPAFVSHVVATLAHLHAIDVQEMDQHTTANFHRLFRP